MTLLFFSYVLHYDPEETGYFAAATGAMQLPLRIACGFLASFSLQATQLYKTIEMRSVSLKHKKSARLFLNKFRKCKLHKTLNCQKNKRCTF